jgi:hypothetical protein
MHHKFAIIDNRLLLTGSYNWTFSANNRNDENLMVIDDPEIIEIFQNQFINLWTTKYSPKRTKELFDKAKVDILTVFPPPAQTKTKIININSASQEELTGILQISKPLAQKIIAFPFMSFPRTRESIILREELGRIQRPTRPYPTTRNHQPRMEGMERTGDYNYYLV